MYRSTVGFHTRRLEMEHSSVVPLNCVAADWEDQYYALSLFICFDPKHGLDVLYVRLQTLRYGFFAAIGLWIKE